MSSHINLQVFMCLKDMFQGYVGGFSSEIKIQVWPIQNWFLGMQSVLGPGPRHMILFLRWGYGLVTSFGYVFNHWCIFFGILIYEFLLEMQKFKVILSSKKFSATKMEASKKIPPENCNGSHASNILLASGWTTPWEVLRMVSSSECRVLEKVFWCFIHFLLVIFRGEKV